MNNKNIKDIKDTSEILSDDDYKAINTIRKIRRHIVSYIKMPILINKIISIIDESDYVSFKNERSRKFIDPKHPIFNIVVDKDFSFKSETYKNLNKFSDDQNERRYFSNIVFDEVITKITAYINESIHNDPELDNYISDLDIFKDVSEEERYQISHAQIVSTLFGMRFSERDASNIVLEMLL